MSEPISPNGDPGAVAAALRLDQRRRWQAGERVPAEDYLRRHPAVAANAEAAVDLVYGEFLLRERLGERPDVDEYRRRFPEYAEALRDQVALHRALDAGAAGGSEMAPAGAATFPALPPGGGEPARPEVPGYEILGELGRGGMGVVYKARQTALDRPTALKMLLAGAYASPEERARFRAEAVAAARLRHPNVVQVYEVGEHHGRLFLALEYVEGGSLAGRLRAGPLPPAEAARLTAVLARAMQHAHQHGVVHRDLKPANVLLSEDGTPKVADFGLARRLDVASGQTQSGAVVGTPGYMAPEQAEGKGKQVGPAADVYALGAILYELLTGRPPFQAATPLDTLLQVLERDPEPPRRLRPEVPRDLETITLKCLRKEPGRRYAGAAELADDLQRFLDGGPVRARPVGRLARLGRWCRRRPLVTGLVLALAVSLLAGAGAVLYLLRAAGPDADIAVLRGRAHLEKKEYDRAVAALSDAVRLDPKRADAYVIRADAWMGLGKPDEALADCVTAMRLDPQLESTFVRWGRGNNDLGKYEDVIVGCTAVIQVNDNHTDAYLLRSNARAMLRQWDAAAADFAVAAARYPRDLTRNSVLFGEACRRLGKGDRVGYRTLCVQAWQRAGEEEKANEVYLIARTCALAPDSGVEPAEVVRLAERAVGKEKTAWRVHALGLALLRAGQAGGAVQRLTEADSLGWRGTANNWLALALVHEARGDRPEARRWLERAVKQPVPYVHPHEAMAYQLLRREAEARLGAGEGGAPP
jgi:serine/threonine-protein kinase